MLESGKYQCAADLAKVEKVNDSYLSRILRLTLLSPDIVEAIVAGRQPGTLQVDDLLRPLPSHWRQQESMLEWQQPECAVATTGVSSGYSSVDKPSRFHGYGRLARQTSDIETPVISGDK